LIAVKTMQTAISAIGNAKLAGGRQAIAEARACPVDILLASDMGDDLVFGNRAGVVDALNPAFAHDHDPIRDGHDFFHVRRHHENGGAGGL
jgi:hypothetical protein